MGNPRKLRKKYSRPGHPWQLARIEEERALIKEFGLKNKREIWKSQTQIKSFANDMKRLLALRTEQADVETKQLLGHLQRIGLVGAEATSDDVLALTASNLLSRRLQTIIVKQGLASTAKQARQFITHGHITIDGKAICSPSYIVPVSDESKIAFVEKSVLFSSEHPARQRKAAVVSEPKVEAEEKPKRAKKPKKEVKVEEKPKEAKK